MLFNSLTHWGRVTHIRVGKLTNIGSDNVLSPGRRQAIIWNQYWKIGPLGTNFGEILIGIATFSFRKKHLKMSFAKWCPCCLGLNVLKRSPFFNVFVACRVTIVNISNKITLFQFRVQWITGSEVEEISNTHHSWPKQILLCCQGRTVLLQLYIYAIFPELNCSVISN